MFISMKCLTYVRVTLSSLEVKFCGERGVRKVSSHLSYLKFYLWFTCGWYK